MTYSRDDLLESLSNRTRSSGGGGEWQDVYLNRIMLHESLILLQWKFRESPPPPHYRVLLLKLSIVTSEWNEKGGCSDDASWRCLKSNRKLNKEKMFLFPDLFLSVAHTPANYIPLKSSGDRES